MTSAVQDARKALFMEQQTALYEKGRREEAEAKVAGMEEQM